MHFPRSECRDLSENVFGMQTSDRTEAVVCLRVLQHVPRSRDLRVYPDPKRSYDIVLRLKQYRDRQWCTSTRKKLINLDIWDLVYDILQQCTGKTLWSHQYGHNTCSRNAHPGTNAMCTAKTERACGPLGSRDVQLKRSAEEVQADTPVAPHQAQSMHPGDGQERDK